MYFQTVGSYDCNYHFALVSFLLEFNFIQLIFLDFVFYIIEDGRPEHVGRHCVCKTKLRFFDRGHPVVLILTTLYI